MNEGRDMPDEADIAELGTRAAAWLAAAADNPEFMLAGVRLRDSPPRPRNTPVRP